MYLYLRTQCVVVKVLSGSAARPERHLVPPFFFSLFFLPNPPFAISAQGRSSHSFYFKDLPYVLLCCKCPAGIGSSLQGWKGLDSHFFGQNKEKRVSHGCIMIRKP